MPNQLRAHFVHVALNGEEMPAADWEDLLLNGHDGAEAPQCAFCQAILPEVGAMECVACGGVQ